jgi:hypothetical protein
MLFLQMTVLLFDFPKIDMFFFYIFVLFFNVEYK